MYILNDIVWRAAFVYPVLLVLFIFDAFRLRAPVSTKWLWALIMTLLPLLGMALYVLYGRKKYFNLVLAAPNLPTPGSATAVPTMAPQPKVHAFPIICAFLTTYAVAFMPILLSNSIPEYVSAWSVMVLPAAGYTYAAMKQDRSGKIANICVAVIVILAGLFYYWWRNFTF